MTDSNTSKGMACPHCNHAISMPMWKGLNSIKNCPSCNKGIRYKKPEFKKLLPVILMLMAVVGVVAAVLTFLGFPQTVITVASGVITTMFIAHFIPKHSSFEKTE